MFLFYAIDGVGLGHLSRTLGVAEAIHQQGGAHQTVFVTEATDARLLEEYPFAYYQVPNRDALFSLGRWKGLEKAAVISAWTGILRSILEAHTPSLVIYDTYIWPEFQSLVRAQGTKQVLIMRRQRDLGKVLDEKRNLLHDVELLVFPHHRHELEHIKLPEYVRASSLYFSGPILRRSTRDLDPNFDRSSFGLKEGAFLITITNGGGNAVAEKADDFFKVVLQAVHQVQEMLGRFQVILVKGPMSTDRIHFAPFDTGDLLVTEYEPHLLELYAASNLVIARGGYNTVLELTEVGVPSICIPALRYHDDQKQRIELAAARFPNIHFAPLELQAVCRLIRDVGRQPLWSYPGHCGVDAIAENKSKLAYRLLALIDR